MSIQLVKTWRRKYERLALLALGLILISMVSLQSVSAQEKSYQSKFQNADWSESEIIKVPPVAPPPQSPNASLDSRASSPSSAIFASSATTAAISQSVDGENWPTDLPKLSNVENAKLSGLKKPLKIEVSESVSVVSQKVEELKKAPEAKVYDAAKQALADSNFALAIPLFQMLCARAPRDPRYFYGAGLAQKASGDSESAFPNLFMAWHLSDEQVYADAANQITDDLKRRLDDTFKLTFQWQRDDPQAVLNAGTRLWKLGLSQQAVQLFEYSLKNDPLYRGIAAYDLGAISEHNGDFKRAEQFYSWALKQRAAIQAQGMAHPEMAAEIVQMEKLCPTTYMETALSDTRSELQRGGVTNWKGWAQTSSFPDHWGSEVCPLCAISRTSLKYDAGQMDLR